MKIIFATQNPNKIKEIQNMLPANINIVGLQDIHVNEDIPETAPTLNGNAQLKANFIWKKFQLPCFADDTGLEVEALNGEPGVRSARYAGEVKNDGANIQLLLNKLQNIPNRFAHFRTCFCFIHKNETHFFEGKIEGEIAIEKLGQNGFGYDPIFVPKGYKKTFAQMTLAEKNKISHRAKALEKLLNHLNNLIV